MKLPEVLKENLSYVFILLVLFLMLLTGCNKSILSKRKKTQDDIQMEFFKNQIKIKQYYITKI